MLLSFCPSTRDHGCSGFDYSWLERKGILFSAKSNISMIVEDLIIRKNIQMKKLRGKGRPKLPKSKALSPTYGARLKPQDEKTVRAAIKQSGLKASDWIRSALVEKAAREER